MVDDKHQFCSHDGFYEPAYIQEICSQTNEEGYEEDGVDDAYYWHNIY